jgi:predicted DNA-binding WGR domain protein
MINHDLQELAMCDFANVDVAKFFVLKVICSNIMKINWGRQGCSKGNSCCVQD